MVREYRRFLVLTQVAGTPVCPSDDVDQAWHFHITRTAEYERFCHEVFGRFVHHHPAALGHDEHERHLAMYAGTLAHYRRAFQAAAPSDVWPEPAQRFAPPAPATGAIRLHGEFASGGILTILGLLAVAALALLLSWFGVLDATHEISGPAFLGFAVPATLLLALLGWLSTSPFDRGSPRDTLDAYEAAWLAGDTPRLAATAIGVLIERGRLRLHATDEGVGWRRRSVTRLVVMDAPRADELHPVELACLAAERDGALRFERAHLALRVSALRIRTRLRGAGLAADDTVIAPARAALAIVTGGWLAVEIERIVHAFATPRPMSFLVLLAAATTIAFAMLTLRSGRENWRGRRALRALEETVRIGHARDAARATRGGSELVIDARRLPITLALLGPAAVLGQPLFAGLDDALGPEGMRHAMSNTRSDKGADGGGCGSGCGGGGCGGGGCGG